MVATQSPNLSAGITYSDYLNQNPTLLQEPSEVQAQVAREFFDNRMQEQPGWDKEPPEIKQQAWVEFQSKYNVPDIKPAHTASRLAPAPVKEVSLGQGLANLGGAIGQGAVDFGAAALNPQTYSTLAEQAGNAIQTQAGNMANNGLQGIADSVFATGVGSIQGLRGLGQGALSLPADIMNAYQGQNVYKPAVNLPQLPQQAQTLMDKYPVSSFLGEQVPYLIPFGNAARATKAVSFAKAAGQGAAIGALTDTNGNGLKARVSNAAMGAALPTVLGAGGRVLKGKVSKYVSETKAKQQNGPESTPAKTQANQAETKQQARAPQQSQVVGKAGIDGKEVHLYLGDDAYGLSHITKSTDKVHRILNQGYKDVPSFVQEVANNHNQIWKQPNGRLMLVKANGKAELAVVELRKEADHYSVVSAYVAPKHYPKGGGRKLVWEKSETSSPQSGAESRLLDSPDTKTGSGSPGARSQTSNMKDSTPKNPLQPSDRGSITSNGILEEATTKKPQGGGPEQVQGLQDRAEVGNRKPLSAEQTAKAQEIRQKVQDFRGSKLDSERMALASEIYSMAQEVDRGVFREALKDIPQEVIDDIGRRLGC